MLQKLIRKQMCLHREVMPTLKIAPLDRLLGLLHERLDLIQHGLLIGVELADFRRLRQTVAGISRVAMWPGHAQVVTLNDTCHLAGV